MGLLKTPMRRRIATVASLLLALWVPATMHCALETVPGFSFLQWCCDADDSRQTPRDCEDGVCGEVESGSYRIEDPLTVASIPAMILAFAAWDRVAEPTPASATHFIPSTSAPPELPRFWQFSCRTALPPRAPCLIA